MTQIYELFNLILRSLPNILLFRYTILMLLFGCIFIGFIKR